MMISKDDAAPAVSFLHIIIIVDDVLAWTFDTVYNACMISSTMDIEPAAAAGDTAGTTVGGAATTVCTIEDGSALNWNM